MKRYIIRAIKYFLYLCVLLTLVMAILVCVGAADANPATMFKDGYKSLGLILFFFAFMGLVYPKFGYVGRKAVVPGTFEEVRGEIISLMEDHNYALESEDGENMTFRFKSPLTRIMRVWEDRITLTREFSGYRVEGPTKDAARIASALEYKFGYNRDN